MTNLIIANVETLSHDDSYTLAAFLQTVISFFRGGGHVPLPPSGSATGEGNVNKPHLLTQRRLWWRVAATAARVHDSSSVKMATSYIYTNI